MQDIVYLGSSINSDNDISVESDIDNRWLRKQLSKKALSWRSKICLYKLILPVLLYGAESWTMTSSDEQALGVFERKAYVIFMDLSAIEENGAYDEIRRCTI